MKKIRRGREMAEGIDMEKVIERLRSNQEIAQKFFEVEACILSILNFRDLFEKLLTEIREKFGVPHLWVSLIDQSDLSSLIQELTASELLKERLNITRRDLFTQLVENKSKPVLANGELKPFYKLFPENEKYFIKSIAVIPLLLDGELIGSLNLGDYSEKRFQPGMDTKFLEQLSTVVSICLSNVTAHERLKMLADIAPKS